MFNNQLFFCFLVVKASFNKVVSIHFLLFKLKNFFSSNKWQRNLFISQWKLKEFFVKFLLILGFGALRGTSELHFQFCCLMTRSYQHVNWNAYEHSAVFNSRMYSRLSFFWWLNQPFMQIPNKNRFKLNQIHSIQLD